MIFQKTASVPGACVSRAVWHLSPVSESPQFIKSELLPEAFVIRERFHRADWELVGRWIDANVGPKNIEAAWNEAVVVWLDLLQRDLGDAYRVLESEQTVILCAEPNET